MKKGGRATKVWTNFKVCQYRRAERMASGLESFGVSCRFLEGVEHDKTVEYISIFFWFILTYANKD